MKHFYLPFEKRPDFSYTEEQVAQLTEYEKYQLSFHPERPRHLDYLTIFDKSGECFQNDRHGSCIIQTHRAELVDTDGTTYRLMLIGQQSAPSSDFTEMRNLMKNPDEVARWNQGMPTPAAFEKAHDAIEAACKEKRIIITVIDTAGADPTERSEGDGIAWKIGRCMQALAEAPVPTLSIIINRGCSGGAIALTGCDHVLAMEYATYMVISPEACSSILFHTREKAALAAEISQITAKEGLKNGIIDEIISEPEGPAHRFRESAFRSFRATLLQALARLSAIPEADLFQFRTKRWASIGAWATTTDEEIARYEKRVTARIPKPQHHFVIRHKRCTDHSGKKILDPVLFKTLLADNFVCQTCGHRYVRYTAHDYINLILDPGSFHEHSDTRYLIDRDILSFPGYTDKLGEARYRTGSTTTFITGDGTINNLPVVFCATNFTFLGGSFCMSTAEKLWRASETAIRREVPLIIQATGGGARMHEGCASMVGLPKIHVAISRVEKAGLKVITIITDPTLGGVAIGFGSRGIKLFEHNAGNIGFSGKRVIEQYTGEPTSRDFQTTWWLRQKGFIEHTALPADMKADITAMLAPTQQRKTSTPSS